MQRKTVILIISIAVVLLLAIVFIFSYGPRYRYARMFGPGYGHMMGPGHGYGHMMGPDYGYRGNGGSGYDNRRGRGQGYGYGHMMEPEYGYGHMMGPGYSHMGYNMLNMMRSELNLTKDQAEKLYDLAASYRRKYFENRGDIDTLNQLEQQHRKEIEKVLTAEQQNIFNKYKRGFDRYGWFGGCPYH